MNYTDRFLHETASYSVLDVRRGDTASDLFSLKGKSQGLRPSRAPG